MKILFYIESLRSGGKERRLVELIKGLTKYYPEIEMELVLTREDIHYTDIYETGIKIHFTIRKGLKKDPRLFWKFYKIAKKFKPDVINVWGTMVAIYAIPAKILLNVPMINNQITVAPLKVNKGILSHKITFPFSDMIIANSVAGLTSYNAPKKKSIVIYNGFNFDRIKNLKNPLYIKKQFNIKKKFVVGMVASFSDKKDYKTYINAANKILDKRNDVTFLCVGAGNDNNYKKLVTPEHKENIKFLEKQENVESIMNITDIGVLATYSEGISNAIMEFMALGKPVIATDGGGTKELIKDNETGFLVKPKSVDALSSKIDFLINNEEIRIKMGKEAKRVVERKFGIKRMIEEFHFSYKKLINE